MNDPFLQFFERLPSLERPQHVREASAKRKAERLADEQEAKASTEPDITWAMDTLREDVFQHLGDVISDPKQIQLQAAEAVFNRHAEQLKLEPSVLDFSGRMARMTDDKKRFRNIKEKLIVKEKGNVIKGVIAITTLENKMNMLFAIMFAANSADNDVKKVLMSVLDVLSDGYREKYFSNARPLEFEDIQKLDEVLFDFVTDEQLRRKVLIFLLKTKGNLNNPSLSAVKAVKKVPSILNEKFKKELVHIALKSEYNNVRQFAFTEIIPSFQNRGDIRALMLHAIKKTNDHVNLYSMVKMAGQYFETDGDQLSLIQTIVNNSIVKNADKLPDTNDYKRGVFRAVEPVIRAAFQSINDEQVKDELLGWVKENDLKTVFNILSQETFL